MQFNKALSEKIEIGDALTDTELQVACDHFETLEALLMRSGPQWGIARFSAIWESNRLRSYREARQQGGRYRPAERGVFDINYRDGEYRVSIPNFDGGKVVTIERHEAALAEARFEARMAKAPTDVASMTLEALESVRKEIVARWKGGSPQEVVDDILNNVLEPAIQQAQAAQNKDKAA
jgi:hypothetical protein